LRETSLMYSYLHTLAPHGTSVSMHRSVCLSHSPRGQSLEMKLFYTSVEV
jgi:hypothetical protein